jgi:hypothetical protein
MLLIYFLTYCEKWISFIINSRQYKAETLWNRHSDADIVKQCMKKYCSEYHATIVVYGSHASELVISPFSLQSISYDGATVARNFSVCQEISAFADIGADFLINVYGGGPSYNLPFTSSLIPSTFPYYSVGAPRALPCSFNLWVCVLLFSTAHNERIQRVLPTLWSDISVDASPPRCFYRGGEDLHHSMCSRRLYANNSCCSPLLKRLQPAALRLEIFAWNLY